MRQPSACRADFLRQLGASLSDAGVTLLEYRNKTGLVSEILADAAILRASMSCEETKLILDDRADLVEEAGFDGVHVDARDMPSRCFGGSSCLKVSAKARGEVNRPGFSGDLRV